MQVSYRSDSRSSLNMDAFELLKVIGKGSFGKVMQVRKRDTSRIYALKTIRKAHIVSRSEVTHTLAERTVLAQVNNPFIVPLKFSFQSPDKLYLVLAFINGGELFHHLQREGRFNEERSRFYAAELLCALEHLHGFNVVYRDLKPENILLDYTGHIALCDFGLCKLNMGDQQTTNTFCGTPEYLSPELLLGQGYTKAVDWWTLGVLLYEMLTGLPPFYSEDVNEMYRKILQDPLRFGDEVSPDARHLLTLLLNRDPAQRLGSGPHGAADIKAHPSSPSTSTGSCCSPKRSRRRSSRASPRPSTRATLTPSSPTSRPWTAWWTTATCSAPRCRSSLSASRTMRPTRSAPVRACAISTAGGEFGDLLIRASLGITQL